jgi:hypothetical protein
VLSFDVLHFLFKGRNNFLWPPPFPYCGTV